MWDFYNVGVHFKEPLMLTGRFSGTAANAPAPVTGVNDSQPSKCTIVRNSTGNLNVTFLDTPMGVVQSADFWVCSNNQADVSVRVTPPAAGVYNWRLNIGFAANGSARDVALGEELHFMIVFSRAGTP